MLYIKAVESFVCILQLNMEFKNWVYLMKKSSKQADGAVFSVLVFTFL